MPVKKKGKKWAIGRGPAIYPTKAAADRAMRGMHAQKGGV
jgi:hypothetical protein